MVHVTWPRLFRGWFVIPGLALAAINLLTKFEVSISTHYKDERRYKISKVGWFGIVRVGSLTVSGNSAIRYSTYEFLLAFHSNYVPIWYRFWAIARYWSKIVILAYPTSIWWPRWRWPRCNFAEIIDVRKLESLGYHAALFAWSHV